MYLRYGDRARLIPTPAGHSLESCGWAVAGRVTGEARDSARLAHFIKWIGLFARRQDLVAQGTVAFLAAVFVGATNSDGRPYGGDAPKAAAE